MSHKLRAAIVDLDGTLVDTLGDFEVALNRTLEDLNLPPVDRAFVERTVGKGADHLVRTVLDNQLRGLGGQATGGVALSWPREDLEQLACQRYQHHYGFANGQHATVFPGVLQGLQQLRAAGLRMACLTNKPLAFAEALLESKGLRDYFDYVFGGDSFERKKPDPLPVLKTCEALGAEPAHTMVIGDSQNDALAARAAGCRVALVTYGYNHGEPVSNAPHDWLLTTMADTPYFFS